ncbi:hypothetical protein BH09ACT12_BH09ACT12_05500 [soil metagenome]
MFSEVADDFLAVLWCLDQYRIANLPPRGMGKAMQKPAQRLSGAYRMKGGWFAELVSLILENQTDSPLAPRSKVQGFSQTHQIDVAWPADRNAPLVCVETKVMGGPAYGGQVARAATDDWTNRRKELKFQATDLKLYRREQRQKIDHWDRWRKVAPPSVYFMWCARMNEPKDNLDRMVAEVRALTETYLDGAGIFAYRPNAAGTGYEVVEIPWKDRMVDLSDLIHAVSDEVNERAADGVPADPVPSEQRPVDVSILEPDKEEPED